MRRLIVRAVLALFVGPIAVVTTYLFASFLGALIPGSTAETGRQTQAGEQIELLLEPGADAPVLLVTNLLHADFAIPVTTEVRKAFAFTRADGIPIDNPALKYLVIGWGAKEFYTSTKEYADIGFGPVFSAVTGDSSVLHIQPAGSITPGKNVIALDMQPRQKRLLLAFVLNTLGDAEKPEILPGATFGTGDVFYEAKGNFNIFNPCNIWASKGLAEAGFGTGIWTPTTFSLLLAHRFHN